MRRHRFSPRRRQPRHSRPQREASRNGHRTTLSGMALRPQGMIRMLALAAMGVCAFFAGSASAAELKLLSALVMKPAISELSSDFEHTTCHKLTLSYDSAGAVKNRLQAGEAADVVIIQKPAVEELIKEGKLIPRSNIILARSGVAAAVARGAPRPDISSTEAFKLALLAARSIAYPIPDAGHASGIHFRGVIERLGI